MRRVTALFAFIALLTFPQTPLAVASASAAELKDLSTDELHALYGNRTWRWSEGAGYFQVKERRFRAFSREGREMSRAEGTWFLPGQGKLCFKGRWTAASYDVHDQTCFRHRTDGSTIFQRREPDGEWIVFRSSRPRSSDEISKLTRGEAVSRSQARRNHLRT